ncbi:MAG: serine hydrolase [Phycisphaeraceae bacterium]|nr:MAG: serine hydrolase [Phycisphaeraceae bacterium]
MTLSNVSPIPGPVLAPLGERWPAVMASPERHRVQVLLTVLSGPARGRYAFRPDAEYFYPASTIKVCACAAALMMIDRLGRAGLVPGGTSTRAAYPDGTRTTVHDLILRSCAISDNDAFNRLFDLAGHEALNLAMWGLGLRSCVLNHHVGDRPAGAEARRTPRVTLGEGPDALEIHERRSALTPRTRGVPGLLVGRARIEGGRAADGPFDMSAKNRLSLGDLHRLVLMIAEPSAEPGLTLSPASRRLLIDAMTRFPRQCPGGDTLPDGWAKFAWAGAVRASEGATATGKSGRAYGFTTENTILRAPGKPTLALTATIDTNENGVVGDDVYEYETIASPFLADLGELTTRWAWATV